MAIILEPKGVTTKSNPTSDTSDLLPLGEKPEGELNSLEVDWIRLIRVGMNQTH